MHVSITPVQLKTRVAASPMIHNQNRGIRTVIVRSYPERTGRYFIIVYLRRPTGYA